MRLTIAFASFPETRSTAIAPSPTGVEIAAIVSSRVIATINHRLYGKRGPGTACPSRTATQLGLSPSSGAQCGLKRGLPRQLRQNRVQISKESAVLIHGSNTDAYPFRQLVLAGRSHNSSSAKQLLKNLLTVSDFDQNKIRRARYILQASLLKSLLQKTSTCK